jgi:hypothetical protein
MFVGPALSVVDAAQSRRPSAKKVTARPAPEVPQVVGTVTYDNGTNVGFHPDGSNGTNLNRTVGNRFNSALGGPLLGVNAMVTRLTVFPANSGTQSVSIAGPPTPANTAMVLDVFLVSGLMAGQFNQITLVPPTPVGPDFLGIFLGAYATNQPAGLLGMSDMQVNGQQYHAFQAFYGGLSMQTMIETVPNRNAMLRAFGDILTPVELMDFKIQ